MHVAASFVLAFAVWFILLIVTGFNTTVFICAPLIISGVVLLACLLPTRRASSTEGVMFSSLER